MERPDILGKHSIERVNWNKKACIHFNIKILSKKNSITGNTIFILKWGPGSRESILWTLSKSLINLRPDQNNLHSIDAILRCIFLKDHKNSEVWGPVHNMSALVYEMTWDWTHDKPSPEPIIIHFTDAQVGCQLDEPYSFPGDHWQNAAML